MPLGALIGLVELLHVLVCAEVQRLDELLVQVVFLTFILGYPFEDPGFVQRGLIIGPL